MASNFTEHFQLSQWEASDQVLREDFNADNAKIDAALTRKGNCEIVTGSYVGTGEYGKNHPCALTFNQRPMIIFLAANFYSNYNSAQEYHILTRNLPRLTGHHTNESNVLTWTEYGVSWYNENMTDGAKRQYNELGVTYEYIALLM